MDMRALLSSSLQAVVDTVRGLCCGGALRLHPSLQREASVGTLSLRCRWSQLTQPVPDLLEDVIAAQVLFLVGFVAPGSGQLD